MSPPIGKNVLATCGYCLRQAWGNDKIVVRFSYGSIKGNRVFIWIRTSSKIAKASASDPTNSKVSLNFGYTITMDAISFFKKSLIYGLEF